MPTPKCALANETRLAGPRSPPGPMVFRVIQIGSVAHGIDGLKRRAGQRTHADAEMRFGERDEVGRTAISSGADGIQGDSDRKCRPWNRRVETSRRPAYPCRRRNALWRTRRGWPDRDLLRGRWYSG